MQDVVQTKQIVRKQKKGILFIFGCKGVYSLHANNTKSQIFGDCIFALFFSPFFLAHPPVHFDYANIESNFRKCIVLFLYNIRTRYIHVKLISPN